MYLHDEIVECESRSDRVEIFPFYDTHVGKKNCAETAIRKQANEIARRGEMKNRHVRVVLGGDQINAINPADIRRFDFHELADWFIDSDAEATRERLSDMANQEINRAIELFGPVNKYIIGALSGNHEKQMRTRQNVDVHQAFCNRMKIINLTDEALIRFRFRRGAETRTVKIYMRHGYGSGRTAGAEPMKLQRMLDEWEDADILFSGHTHSFCLLPPKPILYVPDKGKLPTQPFYRYRYAANPGCWLLSHPPGRGTYESASCYPARPMMTVKAVIWPFWHTKVKGQSMGRPKIELRTYTIL